MTFDQDTQNQKGGIRTISREDWEAMSIPACREVFSDYSIHVVTSEESSPPHQILLGITNWDPDSIREQFPTDKALFVHGTLFIIVC